MPALSGFPCPQCHDTNTTHTAGYIWACHNCDLSFRGPFISDEGKKEAMENLLEAWFTYGTGRD